MLSAAEQPGCARAGAVSVQLAGRNHGKKLEKLQKSWQEAAVWISTGCRSGREPEVLVVR